MAQVSDAAVLEKTGKTRNQWVKTIDAFGGEQMTHKEIASKLWDDKLITSSWWCQQVTVDYELAKGRRVKGQTIDAGFEIGVQKMIEQPASKIWDFLTSEEGLRLWLGDISVDDIKFDKGEKYETKNGDRGEIRSVYPDEKLRLTWQPKERSEPTTLQIFLECNRNTPDRTNLGFHQEKLSDSEEREQMRKRWKLALEAIKNSLT